MKRILLILAILMLCFAASCQGEAKSFKPEDALIVDGASAYVITRPDIADSELTDAAIKLRKSLIEQTGLELEMGTDFYKPNNPRFTIPECEILIGTTNRDITAGYTDKVPRGDDWLIARSGTKVLILGKNKLEEAVDYFLANYVHEGNLYVPDGELYVSTGDYKFDAITIGELDASQIKVGFIRGSAESESCAKQLADMLSLESGYEIKLKSLSGIADAERGMVVFALDESLEPFEISCKEKDGVMIVGCGILASLEDSCNQFISQLSAKTVDKKIALDTISFNETKEEENMNIADKQFMSSLEKKAEEMKNAVLSTKSEYTVGTVGKIYYFSESGDDKNDGLSPEKPKKTIEALNKMTFVKGDVVLFKRGELFRGNITAAAGVTYSAYGEGAKPIISASKRNYADPFEWEQTEKENVWVCTRQLTNVGIVALDHSGELGKYDELVGKRMVKGVSGFEGIESMNEDLQVWSDLKTNKLYFYSEQNPGTRFKSIEIGERGNTIAVGGAQNVTIDNLHITLTGSHGVGAGTTKNLTVRNCVFNWLGGSILTGFSGGDVTGYGNAVEVYGGVDGYTVYNNWIYQIYDTGITHQYSKTATTLTNKMNDVEYYDNLIEYCFWSIEYYNSTGGEGTYRETTNVDVHDNYCRMGGYGWGCPGRETGTPMYCIGSQADKTENYVTRNNIFENCLGYLVTTYGAALREGYSFTNNTYVQPYGVNFGNFEGGVRKFDGSAADVLAEKLGESDAKLYFIMDHERTVK